MNADANGDVFEDQTTVPIIFHLPDGSRLESLFYQTVIDALEVGTDFKVRVPLSAADPRLAAPLAGLPRPEIPYEGTISRIARDRSPVEVWIQ